MSDSCFMKGFVIQLMSPMGQGVMGCPDGETENERRQKLESEMGRMSFTMLNKETRSKQGCHHLRVRKARLVIFY